eukprot:GHVH01003383.1.p2 GENE.GHVH01003383.1~~GHVH01003383.1.p2  ORF type:complete len:325 (+),score=52.27 GHVH01003383.1:1859-2833(+)
MFTREAKMLKRNARLRKEYLETKRLEDAANLLIQNKKVVIDCHKNSSPVPTHLLDLERQMRDKLNLEDIDSLQTGAPTFDSEYALAGIRDPRILLTTSRDAGKSTVEFTKELAIMLPNCHRINRGGLSLNEMIKVAQLNEVTDVLLVGGSAKNGYPTSLTVSHLPFGPTAVFELKDVRMRHQLPNKPPPMPTHNPHLIFHQFNSKIGNRFMHILKFLFPANTQGDKTSKGVDKTRVLSFVNKRDNILFRHHTFVNTKDYLDKDKMAETDEAEQVELTEIGPRFTLKPYRITCGTLDMGTDVEREWTNPTFLNRPKAILSDMGLN